MENDIIHMLIEGCNKDNIASKLGCSRSEIDKYIESIYSKYKVNNRIQLAITFNKLKNEH